MIFGVKCLLEKHTYKCNKNLRHNEKVIDLFNSRGVQNKVNTGTLLYCSQL